MAIKFLNTVAVDTDVLYVDASSNRVGIGTTSPSARLEVVGTYAATPLKVLRHGDYGNVINIGRNGVSETANIGYPADATINLSTNSSERMRIDSSGNVSIGTTSTSTVGGIAKMTINVGTSFNRPVSIINGTTDGMYIRRYSTGGSYQLQTTLSNANSGNLSLQSYGGNVGIGTTSPLSKLHLNGGTNVNLQIGGVGTELQIKTTNDADSAYIPMVLRASEYNILNGNVGIGTTSPNHLLDVESAGASARIYNLTSDGNTDLYLTTTGTTGASRLLFGDTADNDIGKIIYRNNGDSMAFETNAGERMRITSGGNVGIGTTNPQEELHIASTVPVIRIEDTDGGYAQVVGSNGSLSLRSDQANTVASSIIDFTIDNSEKMRVTSAGNVGIGTTSPGSTIPLDAQADPKTLEINGDATDAVLSLRHNIERGGDIWSDRNAANLIIDSRYDSGNVIGGEIRFRTRTSETIGSAINAMTIKQDGNVGIGTTSPTYKLQVEGNAYVDSTLSVANTSTSNSYIYLLSSSTGESELRMGDSDSDAGSIAYNNASDFMAFRANAAERMRITSGGNVGIGTTNPSEKLEVAGNARITGDVTLSNGNALRWTSDDVRIEGTTAGDNIKFYVANTEILQLAQSGTLATVTGNLRVTGAYYDSNNLPGTSGQVLSSTATGTDWVSLSEISGVDGTGTANTVAMWSDSDTITDAPITVSGNNATFAGDVSIGPKNNATVQVSESGGATVKMLAGSVGRVGTYSNNNFILTTNSQNALTLDTSQNAIFSGNVGIGTTSPTRKLTVNGSADVFDSLLINSNTPATDATTNAELVIQAKGNQAGTIRSSQWYFQTIPDSIYGNSAFRIAKNYDGGSTSEYLRILSNGNVGIGTTSPAYKLDVSGGARAGGVITYSKSAGSLNTTGYAVAGITALPNGNGFSCGFTFTCFGHTGKYQKIVYSCYNVSGTWNTKKVIDEGTNDFDVEASANATTITFTFKSTSGTKSYTPRVTVEATGSAINSTYA